MEKTDLGGMRFLIHGFLSPDECQSHIHASEALGYEEAAIQTRDGGQAMNKAIRNNDRILFDDPALAQRLLERVRPWLPDCLDNEWQLVGLNERFRFYRYTPEQYFKWHRDGAFQRSPSEISQLTLLIYLNDNYQGGATQLRDEADIRPEAGMALVFPHRVMHQGSPITAGVKYVLRTDVMYRRIEAGATPTGGA
ncbi:prolyl hydroxylase family protein [Metapseudomonas otitidis]|uniref:prolyl hydroxylase family protein n=1 Tax=Metapseudomonas otitidis TaxID=319939 RepID=UPI0013F68F40|nr:2OG-Fe(II) oxygenase [Pseudomonas otitidis]